MRGLFENRIKARLFSGTQRVTLLHLLRTGQRRTLFAQTAKSIPTIFCMGFVFLLLVFLAVALFKDMEHFDKIIGFAGTLIGSITGYYFGGKHIETSTSSNQHGDAANIAAP